MDRLRREVPGPDPYRPPAVDAVDATATPDANDTTGSTVSDGQSEGRRKVSNHITFNFNMPVKRAVQDKIKEELTR